jgi:hypothetical protein
MVFNTSCFSNQFQAADRVHQRKALVFPLDKFDGTPENVLQHQMDFTQRMEECGMVNDFSFVLSENQPPATVDMNDLKQKGAWLLHPQRYSYGNLLEDASKATMANVTAARDYIRGVVKTISLPPTDPTSIEALATVSFQNRQMIYTLLTNSWTVDMKAIMSKYLETHGRDGVVLYYCFLKHFAGTTTEHLIEAYQMLTENRMQLDAFQGKVPVFTDFIRKPIRRLLKANQEPSIQHFMNVFHGCLNCSNDEFKAFIFRIYDEYRNGGTAQSWTMLELLDRLDVEYNRIFSLGRWESGKNAEILALTAQIASLTKTMALLAPTENKNANNNNANTDTPKKQRVEKPPNAPKPGASEVLEYRGRTWKYCATCFKGSWNLTHTTAEHKPKASLGRTPPTSPANVPNVSPSTPSTPVANVASTGDAQYEVDFL